MNFARPLAATSGAERLPLGDRIVLVTGGSRGIGAATVRALHRDGATVVLSYGSNEQAATAVAESLRERVELVQADLAHPGAADRLWDAAVAAAGHIDVLVNNAGAWISSPLEDGEAWRTGWARNLALNLQSCADLSRRAIQHFRSRDGGIIVNVTSRSAHRGDDADHLAYGAAKGGLLSLTKGIARGFARDGVLAYAVAPGWVSTDLGSHLVGADAPASPLGDPTPPEDVAEVIAFLASGRSRHSTGATVDITGADYVR
jgi:3-oxoacyl-[acyl-carrier protein] reductase